MFDLDGNGSVDEKEFRKILRVFIEVHKFVSGEDEKLSDEEAISLFSHLDKNGDGILAEKEFMQTCLENEVLRELFMFEVSCSDSDSDS